MVSFDNKIRYHGDGRGEENQLDSGSLDDYNVLMKQGQVFGSDLSLRAIEDSLRYDVNECMVFFHSCDRNLYLVDL